MNKSNVTIYDIAKETGTSPATVSRVLNHSEHPVKQELRERILEASRRLGYIPNLQARSLRNQINTSIGIIIPSIANPFYPSIVRGIEDEIVSRNYHMVLSSCDREAELTNYSIETMLAVNVQGIISIYLDEIPEGMVRLTERGGIALNVASNGKAHRNMHTILVDKVEECKMAVNHLLESGHRRIAILMDRLDNSIRTERLKGYQIAMQESEGVYNEQDIYILGKNVNEKADESAEKGYVLAKAMLRQSPDVTAFICMNDIMALGALKAVREAGKRIPEDYSMVSFDDLVFADAIIPPLTTVGLEQYTWGRQLAQYYFHLAEHPEIRESLVEEGEVLSPSKLILRQSTRSIL